ncbi:MAG: sensor domain-containing protein [Segniliparus sp.]|uniref:sensor domain-containing protein n=1 Tax=Segniliparus sp. TaxID=2804064 RepID=UPI003F3ECBC7
MSGQVRATFAALLCGAAAVSCGRGGVQAPVSTATTIGQSAPQAAAPAPLPAPEPDPVDPVRIGAVLLQEPELAQSLGRRLVGAKEASAPFPDQQVVPESCMTAVDIGFQRQLGGQWSSFAYYYAHTPKEEGAVEVVAEDVAIYPTRKAAGAALDALAGDLGKCSGSRAAQRAQTWQVVAAPVQLKRIVWTTAQQDSRDWHCDYQGQVLANAFFSVMFCRRGDAGGMAASLARAIAGRIR